MRLRILSAVLAGALALALLPAVALAAPWTPVPITLPTGAAALFCAG